MDVFLFLYLFGMIAGLGGLWWSSDKSVEYSLEFSSLCGITTFFVGFVFMAVATGIPELAVVIVDLFEGGQAIAAGTIIGSNLGDVSLVLGVPALIMGTLNVRAEDKRPLILMLLVTLLVMAFVFIVGELTNFYGVILILLYVLIIWWLWKTKATRIISPQEVTEELSGEKITKKKQFFLKVIALSKFLGAIVVVLISSKIAIDCAIGLTRYIAFSLEAVGATIFAIGTSLPELALSLQAVKKKEYSLAFGNSFGSVLEQATLILGFLVIGATRTVDITSLRPIAPLMFLAYGIVAHSVLKKTKVGRQEGLGRKEGAVLVCLFIIHMIYYLVFSR